MYVYNYLAIDIVICMFSMVKIKNRKTTKTNGQQEQFLCLQIGLFVACK